MQNIERWQELCQQASTEQDSMKLMVLIEEINRLLEDKKTRPTAKTAEAKPE
jgi:hypothetical protein